MAPKDHSELINAARSYERIIDERRETFVRSIRLAREGQQDESAGERQNYYNSKDRALAAERLLAERIYGEHDFVRVDDVIYMAYSTQTLLRIPLKDILDLAKEEG